MTDHRECPIGTQQAEQTIAHSPLPWSAFSRTSRDPDAFVLDTTGRNVLYGYPNQVVANAEFICRAVNAHHELLAALRGIKEWCPCDPDINPQWQAAWDAMDAALASLDHGEE